jgi:hypothetical protein
MEYRNKHITMMKRFFTILAFAWAMAACEKAPTVITDDSPEYTGTMIVAYEGDDFKQTGIKVLGEFDQSRTTIDIKLQKVKFVPAMPIRIDVTIMDIPVVYAGEDTWSFEADGLTPWAMGGPYDTYRVDDLRGTISGNSIEFSLGFYNTKKQENYPTNYNGVR